MLFKFSLAQILVRSQIIDAIGPAVAADVDQLNATKAVIQIVNGEVVRIDGRLQFIRR